MLAWPARKRFTAYVSMQLHERKPGFTVEVGWSRGDIDSFFRVPFFGSPAARSKGPGERVRLGELMESSRDVWWWLFPDKLTPAQRIAAAKAVPAAKQAMRAVTRATVQKDVLEGMSDPVLRARLVATFAQRADEEMRIDALAIEAPEQIALLVRTRVDDAIDQVIEHGLPWLAARAKANRSSLPRIGRPIT